MVGAQFQQGNVITFFSIPLVDSIIIISIDRSYLQLLKKDPAAETEFVINFLKSRIPS